MFLYLYYLVGDIYIENNYVYIGINLVTPGSVFALILSCISEGLIQQGVPGKAYYIDTRKETLVRYVMIYKLAIHISVEQNFQ